MGGLFIENRRRAVLGANTEIDFLVREGPIRAEATVKHVELGKGIGVKFTAVKESDHPVLVVVVNRLQSDERAMKQKAETS